MTSKAREQGKESKYKRRIRERLANRVKGYEEAIKRRDYVAGSYHKPGSQSTRKGA